MYKFKIDKIAINCIDGKQEIIPKRVNVIVGPNNSGKSRLLKEIRDYLTGDYKNLSLLQRLDFPYPDNFDELNMTYDIESKMRQDLYGNWMLKVYNSKPNQALDMNASLESYYSRNVNVFGENWKEQFANAVKQKNNADFLNWFGCLFFQYIGTEERLTICKQQRNYGMDSNATNYLTAFKFNDILLKSLADKVKQIFKQDIYLDTQTLGDRLVFRVGENLESICNGPTPNETEAINLFEKDMLDAQGDGLKSFVSTFLSLNYDKNEILLIDEPEAFLHPPLARQMGEMIGESENKDKIIFVATHSVEVLKGILSKCQDVNVIRITQPEPHKNSVKLINQDVLNEVLQNPLLRVSRILEGLFCDRVIITEAEADELVYQELIDKLFPESGLFFAHGQNKQTLAPIARFYQEIGVKYEIIVDFDVLKEPRELNPFLALMPLQKKEQNQIQSYAQNLRKIVNESINIDELDEAEKEDAQKKKRDKVYHRHGVSFFDETMKEKVLATFDELSSYHLHILPTGELETILQDYDMENCPKKSRWVVDAIKKIAEMKKEDFAPTDTVYQFLNKVVNGL